MTKAAGIMDLKNKIQAALSQVRDQQSFFEHLLGETLGWPLGDISEVEDIAYAWSDEDLRAADLERRLAEGRAWQIQPLIENQPWGIFVLEFKNPDALGTRGGMAGTLRKVLRGLVTSRRKAAGLPSWKREHLLFICTHRWQCYRFAYFRAKPDDPRNARLTAFGWAPDTPNRTVCEFNLPALQWPEVPSDAGAWVKLWGEAFDKEPLTKDFFRRFDDALDAVKSDLEEYQKLSSAEAYSQAQLLLERLIFLYFLQNRGWLNQNGHFLPEKLKEYAEKPDAFTYYDDFLDQLFWTLASPPGSAGRLSGIPFLNGGLFDDDEFRQPSHLRKPNPPLRVRNRTFQTVFATLLEAFNFTVTEDTPLNQEVAVDPEMLGKVFESIVLHAEEADPDAVAPDKRKATGSYYTPRIVVHFICREVLYQYLLAHLPANSAEEGWGPRLKELLALDPSDGIDEERRERLKRTVTPAQAIQVLELVKPLRCCDPAVGSGAFPVGLMHELVNMRRLLETAANGYVDPVRKQGAEWLHATKADIVQNCLFGVDIQQQAIEICRLRLWLSLVVDYDLGLDPFSADRGQFTRAIDRISQLPNLEMNFHRGDSLHDHISGVPIVIMPGRASLHAIEFQAIAKLGAKLHKAKSADTKKKLRLQILEQRLAVSKRILEDEIHALQTSDSALDTLFGLTESAADKRKRNEQELERLEEALQKIELDRTELERLRARLYDSQFYPKLRRLEGADFSSPFNFAWRLDFPSIFGANGGGFDLVVGNPPFVTARNPVKRELWRQRWPRVCVGTYQLVCPFFELGFSLLAPGAQLGFIVSNAFAKREFGKPLVEDFFQGKDLQKVVDCSGLMFPGHGTPTCLVFARRAAANAEQRIRNVTTLPGGGDLLTTPEESPLWHSIERHHATNGSKPDIEVRNTAGFEKLFEDFRIAVGDCERAAMLKHPCRWCFVEWPTFDFLETNHGGRLQMFLAKDIGRILATSANDIYILPSHTARLWALEPRILVGITEGDEIRNWSSAQPQLLVKPYDGNWELLERLQSAGIKRWLSLFRSTLGARSDFNGGSYDQVGRPWFEYHQLDRDKARAVTTIAFPDVVTHGHFTVFGDGRLFKDHSPVVIFKGDGAEANLIAGLLDSSAALFWLKQVCFNKGAGEDEERDRFEFAGGKVQQLPVPEPISFTLKGETTSLGERITKLSKACWERGQRMPGLSLKKLFDKPGEAYHDWNSSLPGYVSPGLEIGPLFQSGDSLRESFCRARQARERLRAEMIALQEEMDWLVYAAYGLLSEDHPAVALNGIPESGGPNGAVLTLEPLDREQRPFRLWAAAEGDFPKAVALIPATWPEWRRKLWEARLAAIRDNEHIRRIEQPVYKRRWDEQWKVKNRWRCGPVAYAAEFVEAFEWWLRERAELWLEHKRGGGPIELDHWAEALWKDTRVQAAWEVAAENYAFLAHQASDGEDSSARVPVPASEAGIQVDAVLIEDPPEPLTLPGMEAARRPHQTVLRVAESGPPPNFNDFRKAFKRIVDDETVPENIPWAVPYEELEKIRKIKVPAKVKSIRGKLNVPRERFHLHARTQYLWAGLQFRD